MAISLGFIHPLGDGTLTKSRDGDGFYSAQNFNEYNNIFASYHLGEDWNGEGGGNTDLGVRVNAISNGTVTQSAFLNSLGNYVVIRHDLPRVIAINGITTSAIYSLYAHLQNPSNVGVGAVVTQGQKIGQVGYTGDAGSFAHLHFEIRLGTGSGFQDTDGYNPGGAPVGWVDPTKFINDHRTLSIAPVPANAKPTAVAHDQTVAPGTHIALSNLFTYADSDDVTDIVSFDAKDFTVGGGHLEHNGKAWPDGQLTDDLPIAELKDWYYVVGASGSVDKIGFNVTDRAGAFNPTVTATVTAQPIVPVIINAKPTAVAYDQTVAAGTRLALSTLFTYADSDGVTDVVSFDLKDFTIGGGHLEHNGKAWPDGQLADDLPIAELKDWYYVVGASGSVDRIGFNVADRAGESNPTVTATVRVPTAVTPTDPTKPPAPIAVIWSKPVGLKYSPMEGAMRVTQGFGGDTSHGNSIKTADYAWIDLAAVSGTAVLAMADGIVIGRRTGSYAGDESQGKFGNYITIKFDSGLIVTYAHLSSANVKVNERVVGGSTVIGFSGSTGVVEAPHLHLSFGTSTTGPGTQNSDGTYSTDSIVRAAISLTTGQIGSPGYFESDFSTFEETAGLLGNIDKTDIFGSSIALNPDGSVRPNSDQDELVGGGVGNRIFGGSGNDRLYGAGGNDILVGGTGNDRLSGGDGLDTLIGGLGRDIMTGGRGGDTFDFNSINEIGNSLTTRDRIKDFTRLSDRIDLGTIDAASTIPGIQQFKFIGRSEFSKIAGELRYKKIAPAGTLDGKTIISGDVDGDGQADFQIDLLGLISLTRFDFILI
jgi:murein DD-endopeptidase MepM/ murein hydrolase activator NlpD